MADFNPYEVPSAPVADVAGPEPLELAGRGARLGAKFLDAPVWLIGAIPLLGPIFSLVDACFIFRDDRRCIHDLMADTIVVRLRA